MMNMVSEGRAVASRLGSMCGGAAAEAFRKFSVHFDGYGRFGEGELAPPERVIENPTPADPQAGDGTVVFLRKRLCPGRGRGEGEAPYQGDACQLGSRSHARLRRVWLRNRPLESEVERTVNRADGNRFDSYEVSV